MNYGKNNRIIPFLAILFVLAVCIPYAHSTEQFRNEYYGYEFEPSPDWKPDMSGSPDTIVWSVGEGGRFMAEVIPFNGEEYEEPVPEDVAADVKGSFGNNFDEFTILDESWSTNMAGRETFDFNFECEIDGDIIPGTARVTFGRVNILMVYYDDRADFEYNLPDVQLAVADLIIDERAPRNPSTTGGKPVKESVEFVNPLRSVYINETLGYSFDNPGRLTPEELNGPGLVRFTTGEGDITVRYLDTYMGTGKGPDVFIEELLNELLVSYSRFDISDETDVSLNDGRDAYRVDLDAVYNGDDWQGSIVGFVFDRDAPFIIIFLAPVDEYKSNEKNFQAAWQTFTFSEE